MVSVQLIYSSYYGISESQAIYEGNTRIQSQDLLEKNHMENGKACNYLVESTKSIKEK